jgi:hypothetical protein
LYVLLHILIHIVLGHVCRTHYPKLGKQQIWDHAICWRFVHRASSPVDRGRGRRVRQRTATARNMGHMWLCKRSERAMHQPKTHAHMQAPIIYDSHPDVQNGSSHCTAHQYSWNVGRFAERGREAGAVAGNECDQQLHRIRLRAVPDAVQDSPCLKAEHVFENLPKRDEVWATKRGSFATKQQC